MMIRFTLDVKLQKKNREEGRWRLVTRCSAQALLQQGNGSVGEQRGAVMIYGSDPQLAALHLECESLELQLIQAQRARAQARRTDRAARLRCVDDVLAHVATPSFRGLTGDAGWNPSQQVQELERQIDELEVRRPYTPASDDRPLVDLLSLGLRKKKNRLEDDTTAVVQAIT